MVVSSRTSVWDCEGEPDYLKFLQEAERKAVDPDLYLDVNDENESGWDAEEKGLLEEAVQSWSRLKRNMENDDGR